MEQQSQENKKQPGNVNRKILNAAVAAILQEHEFGQADKDCIETLTEMLQGFICDLGSLVKNASELAGRTEPMLADLIMAFVEEGYNFTGLSQYVKSTKHAVLPTLSTSSPTKHSGVLSAGSKQPLPPHIPQHFPHFPDPYAYVRTPTHKQPVIDYESVREKAAAQKKDVEKALTKFLAKTNPTLNLFDSDEANIFPLIASKPTYPPYLSALMPMDQIFDPEDLEYDHKSQMLQQQHQQQQQSKKLKKESKEIKSEENGEENLNDSAKSEDNISNNYIDNPYLAATKLPHNDSN